MKSAFLITSLFLSVSAFSAPIATCSKSFLWKEANGSVIRNFKAFPLNLTIDKKGKDDYVVTGTLNGKTFRYTDIFVQNWGPRETKGFIELSDMYGGEGDIAKKIYQGMVTADTYDVAGQMSLIVSKDKNKKVNKIHFTIDDQMGVCQ